MTNISWTELIAVADKPNVNGVVYPRKVLEDAIAEYMKQTNRFGQIDATLELKVPAANISHSLRCVYWEGDKLYGTIDIHKTPAGAILEELVTKASECMTLGMSLLGKFEQESYSRDLFEHDSDVKIIDDMEIRSVNALQKRLTNH